MAQDRRARVAVAALFLTNGAIFANLLPRYPEIKADLHLSNAVYGAAIAAFSGGALVAGLAAAALIRRFYSSRVAVIGTIGIATFVVVAGFATVAACARRRAVHRRRLGRDHRRGAERARPAGTAQLRPVDHQFVPRGVGGRRDPRRLDGCGRDRASTCRGRHIWRSRRRCSAPLSSSHTRTCSAAPITTTIRQRGRQAGAAAGSAVYAMLAALVVIAIAGATVEDAGSSWATLYLRDSLGAPGAIAVFGYVALVGFMFLGRLIGDRLVDRFGERIVVRAGGFVTAAGMGAALAFPSVPGTIAGFAAAGFGVATLIPAAMHGADQLPGMRPGTGLTVVTWLMRVGLLRCAAACRRRRRRGQPARRPAFRSAFRCGGDGPGGGAQWTAPAISIVSTPATMKPMPSTITQVSGSANRYRAITATSATPHAVHTP